MTVSTLTSENSYEANGVTTVFPYTFRILTQTDLKVLSIDEDGVETDITSGFTVSGVGAANGGNVTFSVAPDDGLTIVVYRDVPYTQPTDYKNQGPFYGTTHERSFDRVTMLVQQLYTQIGRTLRFGPGESLETLAPGDRTGKYITFDSDGNPILSTGTGADAGLRTDLSATDGASLIGYDPGFGSGTTVQQALRTSVILNPPAAPADATSYMEDAIDFAVGAYGTGVRMILPAGEFYMNLTVTDSEVVIEGQGSAATTIRNYGNTPAITFSNANGDMRNYGLRHLYLRNRDKTTYTSADGIYIDGTHSPSSNECDFPIFENVELFQFRDNISINGRCIWGTWKNVNSIEAIRDGVHVEGSDNVFMHSWDMCRIAANGRQALYFNLTFASLLSNWSFRDCNIENNVGVPVYVTGVGGFQNMLFDSCYFEENTSGVSAGGSGSYEKAYIQVNSAYAYGLRILGCTFFGMTAPAADPDYYIFLDPATVNVTVQVEFNRFDTAVVYPISVPYNLHVAKNVNQGTVDTDRDVSGYVEEDLVGAGTAFTPELRIGGSGTGITYSNQQGRYVRHGNQITFTLYVALTSKGAQTGALTIIGLPKASYNGTNHFHAFPLIVDQFSSGPANMAARLSANGTTLALKSNATGTLADLDDTHIGNSSTFVITGSYLVR